MRILAVLVVPAVLSLTAPARAGGFVEVVGGVMIPVADNDWTNYVESSPKLGVRAGSVTEKLGGMLSADWTPINTDNQGWSVLGNSVDISSNRFRILGHLVSHVNVGKNLDASARFGAGIDIAHVSVETTFLGTTSTSSDTDTGVALEVGGGLWFKASSVELGVELGIPLSFHADGADNNIDLADYSSFDLDLLFGVRFSQN